MTNYPIGDYLIQVKNAARAGRREILVDQSNFVENVAKCLKRMGILESVEVKDKKVVSRLSYHKKAPILMDLKLVSAPGLRKYVSIEGLMGRKRKNASVLVLSTPQGILSSSECMKKNAGGEVIAEIW